MSLVLSNQRPGRVRLAPTVRDAASVLLPTQRQTALLRAALLAGRPAHAALAAWLAAIDGSLDRQWREDLGLPTLLSMLDEGVHCGRIELEAPLRPLVRAAAARETARARHVTAACREVLSSLQRAAIPAIVLRGVTLAHTAYERPGLRHCHDLDLLIRPADLARAREALLDDGGCAQLDTSLLHGSALPVELHAGPAAAPATPAALESAWSRCLSQEVAGAAALTLQPIDELLWLCAHAVASPRRSSQWAVDANVLLRASPPDWGDTVARAVELRTAAPAALLLGWLRDELSACVPDQALAELAGHVDRAAEDELLARARQMVGAAALLGRVRRRRQRLGLLWRLAHCARPHSSRSTAARSVAEWPTSSRKAGSRFTSARARAKLPPT